MKKTTFGYRIKESRLRLGLSQNDLADKVRVITKKPFSRGTIASLECGISFTCSARYLLVIAHILGVDPYWLFYGKFEL